MRCEATYRRAHRIATGEQLTVPIPVKVLAKVLDRSEITETLGPDLVAAIRKAVQS